MKKFINSADTVTADAVTAFVKNYEDRLQKLPDVNVVARRVKTQGKVGVVIGNGAGHEPACIGFVGENALDANAYGYLFAAPGPNHLLAAIHFADTGAGVVVLVSNHAGDVLNSHIAVQWAIEDGIDARYVVLYDDVLSAPKEQPLERRGTAGTYFNYRMAGAYAAQGHSIDEVVQMVERIRDDTCTVTIASLPGISPITGEPMFELADDRYQLGVGVHGESSPDTVAVAPVSEIASMMTELLVEDGEYQAGEELLVLVNGCGGTTQMELLSFCGEVRRCLESKGIEMVRPAVGSFITTQEMQGIALSFCRADKERQQLWFSRTDAPGFPRL